MRIAEIRDLDGPNLFLHSPAIKVELEDVPESSAIAVLEQLETTILHLHQALELDTPEIVKTAMETPGHLAVAFSWSRRSLACSLGTWAAQLVTEERSDPDHVLVELQQILASEPADDDAPLVIRPSADRIPIVAITGTNGKTTTSRLITFVLKHAGHKVGLTSSAGVYIDTEAVLTGDYSGPSGARRVLAEPGVEYAVLETARGGMLLRGCGFEDADVAVITNVTEDHLGVHGIHSVDGLAAVKAIIARNIKPGGFCVLNAEDDYVRAMKDITPGLPVLFSGRVGSEHIAAHQQEGGSTITVNSDGDVIWHHQGMDETVIAIADIPMTFNGMASHQVENSLAAMSALIGLGLSLDEIRLGVKAFRSSSADSKGRLNVYDVHNGVAIIDFAHNEAGLKHLLTFARNLLGAQGRLITIVGTAGDREDQALRAIAKRAVEGSDIVVLKDSLHYLRGRQPGDMLKQMQIGVKEASRPAVEVLESPDERTATFMMVDQLQPGDVLAVMCVEDYDYILKELDEIGTARV